MILFGHRTGERFSGVLLDGAAAAAGARGSWSYFFPVVWFLDVFFVCLVSLLSRGSVFFLRLALWCSRPW